MDEELLEVWRVEGNETDPVLRVECLARCETLALAHAVARRRPGSYRLTTSEGEHLGRIEVGSQGQSVLEMVA